MIEKVVLDCLKATLPCPVWMETPKNPPPVFALIEKTGGGQGNRIHRATLAVQSCADSLLAAAELNEQVKAAMENLTELDEVSACRLNADYNFTDTQTKRYRYQAVYDLVFY